MWFHGETRRYMAVLGLVLRAMKKALAISYADLYKY